MIRLLLYPIAGLLYRIRVVGREHVPRTGAALLVSNHVSFIDALLILMASRRPVRFLMFRGYYQIPVAHLFFRAMKCIPISGRDSPKELLESFRAARAALEHGEAVCIFAEGEISRHGQMLRFKKGFERIVEGLDVPIVPVHLDQVWGSLFSFSGGRALFKRPRRLPYPVTVSFGARLPSAATAFQVRQAILELGSDSFRHRLEERPPLPIAFLREAKRHPLRLAAADSLGVELNYGQLLVRSHLWGRILIDSDDSQASIGVLLPPCAAAAAANLGISLAGRVPVNLSYGTSREIAVECLRKAEIRTVVTSRKFLERLGWEPVGDPVYVEDLAARMPRVRGAVAAAALLTLPSAVLERTVFRRARGSLDRVATVIFTSGSTGFPKGVLLTHANILSNIEAVTQIYELDGRDRVLGVLPFFHSFGFTGTLWLPLVSGQGAVYHAHPLDAARVGDLVERYRITHLLATPTFLAHYLRRVEREKFRSLRAVVVGAEKLRGHVARAFEEKFGLTPLEGYGCTELSPVAAVNIPDIDWPGVRQKGGKPGTIGHPLPGTHLKVVDPETGQTLPAGAPGLLLVKGPNVMKGYLGEDDLTAASLRDGYYVTGDIASIDPDGFVTITDRLSRFSKVGGEMVPHISVEEKLHELAGVAELTFVVASVPDAAHGERLIVLHTGYKNPGELHKKLQASGLPKLWIPDRDSFREVAELPLLASGKLDLQKLKALAQQSATQRPAG